MPIISYHFVTRLSSFNLPRSARGSGLETVWQSLQLIRSILRGAATLLPDGPSLTGWGEGESDPSGSEDTTSLTDLPPLTSGLFQIPSYLVDVRESVAALLHSVLLKMEGAGHDSALLLLCKVYHVALNHRGIGFHKFQWRKQLYKASKAKYRSIASFQLEKKTLPRRLLGMMTVINDFRIHIIPISGERVFATSLSRERKSMGGSTLPLQ